MLTKYLDPRNYLKRIKRIYNKFIGDVFANPGPITDEDFKVIKDGIDEVQPRLFIEIGTGNGVSAGLIFKYLNDKYPECEFYTLDVFEKYTRKAYKRVKRHPRFHTCHGLSVRIEETEPPAFHELKQYNGPVDVLRQLLSEHTDAGVDIAFIDSRKGTALAEFRLLESHMNPNGLILCHDILNDGKGVEVLAYIKGYPERYTYEVLNTGEAGMIRIRFLPDE